MELDILPGRYVAIGGYLMTYLEPDLAGDMGQRLADTGTAGDFRCPSCGETGHEPEEPITDNV